MKEMKEQRPEIVTLAVDDATPSPATIRKTHLGCMQDANSITAA